MSSSPWNFSGLLSPDLNNDNKGIGAQFDRLLRNLELTSTQVEAASTRHKAIREKLETAFPGAKTFIVGSYAKNTSIRPPSDLDIFLVLPDSIFTKYNSFTYMYRNAQSELLQEVKTKIQKYYPNTTMTADGQVVIVPFASSFSVEIVPAFAKALVAGDFPCPG
jgi:tRNA nucleotidyltransferase (CCA-adding enzyme)